VVGTQIGAPSAGRGVPAERELENREVDAVGMRAAQEDLQAFAEFLLAVVAGVPRVS
jgi:hypothetical protein